MVLFTERKIYFVVQYTGNTAQYGGVSPTVARREAVWNFSI